MSEADWRQWWLEARETVCRCVPVSPVRSEVLAALDNVASMFARHSEHAEQAAYDTAQLIWGDAQRSMQVAEAVAAALSWGGANTGETQAAERKVGK